MRSDSRTFTRDMNPYLAALLIYSVVMMAVGAVLSRRVRRASDFLVAGRSLGGGLIFSTLLAANIGAGSTVGAAALGYSLGMSAWWWVGSAGIGCLFLAHTVGPRIWRLARANDLQTLGDFLEFRYNRTVRGLCAAILWFGSLGLLAAQLIALSILFDVVAGLPRWLGSTLSGVVVLSYFVAGGLLGSAWVNALQVIVLLCGFGLSAWYALASAGGWGAIVATMTSRLGETGGASYVSVFGIGATGVLYYVALLTPSFIVSPGLVQKLYGARSASAARRGINANALVLLAYALVPALLGMAAAARFPSLADPQYAIFRLMTENLPLWLGILGIAAIFSAEISTCDAVLFMLSSSLTIDLYRSFLDRDASERRLLLISRLSAGAAGAGAVAISITMPSIIGSLTLFYSLVTVALFVPVISGLFSTRPSASAALAAIAVSVPATLALNYGAGAALPRLLNPFLAGLIISLVVLWGVTVARAVRHPRNPQRPSVG